MITYFMLRDKMLNPVLNPHTNKSASTKILPTFSRAHEITKSYWIRLHYVEVKKRVGINILRTLRVKPLEEEVLP